MRLLLCTRLVRRVLFAFFVDWRGLDFLFSVQGCISRWVMDGGQRCLLLLMLLWAARYLLFFGDMVSDFEIGVVMRLDKIWMA